MKRPFGYALPFALAGLLAMALLLGWSGNLAQAQSGGGALPDKPKSRADWPAERVTVVGRRGSVRDWLINRTFRGTEGFSDGSAPADVGSRFEFYWQIHYMANGKLEAHFQKLASRTPHGPIEQVGFVEFGTWRINDDGDLCQKIPMVAYETEICYWVERRGDRAAMYYTACGAFARCYVGRLGPEGEIVPGRAFTK